MTVKVKRFCSKQSVRQVCYAGDVQLIVVITKLLVCKICVSHTWQPLSMTATQYVLDSHGYPFMQWYGVGVTRFTHSLVRCVAVKDLIEKHMYSIQLIVVPTPGGGDKPVLYLCIF